MGKKSENGQIKCTTPEQVFAVATSFAAFLAANLTQSELQTLINLFTLLTANLIGIVTQQEICEGTSVVTEADFLP